MATRAAKPAPPECWTVAFFGKGDVSEDNAKELLDKQLFPTTGEIQALLPETVPRRGSRGLRNVETLLKEEWDIPIQNLGPEDMVAQLLASQKDGETVYLVLLGTDDPELAEAALDAGIPVKDLCAALDDVEFEPEAAAEPEPEPEAPRRGRGRPRKDATVAAEVAGPATIVTQPNERPSDTDAAQLLRAAIQQIVREELSMHPGVHSFGPTDEPAEEEKTIRAFINDDGEYRRATKRSVVREGESEVMLSKTEAQEAGLVS